MRTNGERTMRDNEGDRYYVYDGPGDIHYFDNYQSAADYQRESGGSIGKVD